MSSPNEQAPKGEKKARQFDFMSMFEETRKTAAERSQKAFDAQEEEERQKLENIASSLQSSSVNASDSEEDPQVGPSISTPFQSSFVPAAANKSSNLNVKSSHTDSDKDSSDEDEDELIGPPVPSSLSTGVSSQEDEEEIGPPIPGELHEKMRNEQQEKEIKDAPYVEDDDEDEVEENPLSKIPSNNEIVLDHGNKAVSALGMDPSGARVVTGGFDYDVKLWDFAGMDISLRSFRTLRPCESHQIRGLEYSTTGDMILVIPGNSQAKLLDRDGFEKLECIKGDQYIVDPTNTKGHTAMLNSGHWHPKDREEFMTCSNDCSVRLWNINNGKKHKRIVKPKGPMGRKTIPTTCAYSKDGKFVAAACQDGSIQLWDHRKNFVNVALKNPTAHTNGTDTSCLCFSYDGTCMASRGGLGDDTLKLWDIRNIKKPLCVADNLENLFPMTDCLFSPDDQLVVTGVSVRKGHGTGTLVFMDRQTLLKVAEIPVADGTSVVRSLWHPRLNQMVCGCGDGSVKIYYDPDRSHRGVLLSLAKTQKKSKQVEMMISQTIITPYALPMFRNTKPSSTRKQEERSRKDPIKSHRPDLPVSGQGHGGRLGNKGATLSQYVAQNLVKRLPDERDKDPRGAILRHAREASENPYWVDPAYKDTQPTTIFQATTQEEEPPSDDIEPAWKKKKI